VNPYFELRPDEAIYYLYAGALRVAGLTVPYSDPTTSTLSYYHQDHLGGTALATDSTGMISHVYDYYPYGTPLLDETLSGSTVPYSFTGKEYTEDTGLYYFEARWYDPLIGRFVSGDPMQYRAPQKLLADPQALNYYAYARNNPLFYVDPSGQLPTIAWYGVVHGLRTIGYNISATLLGISAQGRISEWGTVNFYENSTSPLAAGITDEIRSTDVYQSALDGIKGEIDGGEFSGTVDRESVVFTEGDLMTAIHGVTGFSWEAEVDENGNYSISITISDKYDFEHKDGNDFLTTVNNMAYEDQEDGTLTNYNIEIHMEESYSKSND